MVTPANYSTTMQALPTGKQKVTPPAKSIDSKIIRIAPPLLSAAGISAPEKKTKGGDKFDEFADLYHSNKFPGSPCNQKTKKYADKGNPTSFKATHLSAYRK